MLRVMTLGLAAIGVAAFGQTAAAKPCLPQHHTYVHSSRYERASRYERSPRTRSNVRYVVVERPRYRTVYEEVYEPAPLVHEAPYYWNAPYEAGWAYDDAPLWRTEYFGAW